MRAAFRHRIPIVGSSALVVAVVLAASSGAQAQTTINNATETVPTYVITSGNWLVVGSDSTGALHIFNSASVSTSVTTLGQSASGHGTVSVSGPGTTWDVTAGFTVGDAGTGAVTISNGAVLTTNGGFTTKIGNAVGATGIVTLDDATWNTSVNISLGGSSPGPGGGTGTLNLVNGAVLNNNAGADKIEVGSFGTGELNVSGGSVLNARYLEIGYDGDAVGTVNVAGAGSKINADYMYVGYVGTGILDVTGGAEVSVDHDFYVSYETYYGTSVATLSGPGSRIDVGGNAHVGEYDKGTMIVSDGAVFDVTGTTSLDAHGKLTITGAGTQFISTGGLSLGGYYGGGTLEILDGATATSGAAILGYRPSNFGGPQTGAVTVSGAGSSWTTSGLTLGLNDQSTGTLTVANGGVVNSGTISVAPVAGSTGTIIIGAKAGDQAVAAGTLNAPTIDFGLGIGALVFNCTSNINFASEIDGGVNDGINVLSGKTNFTGNSNSFGGTMNVVGGTAYINGNMGSALAIVSGTGTLGGSDWIGGIQVQSGGTVAPGNSIGTLTVAGDGVFEAGSKFAVEVNGAQSDMLYGNGYMTLNGGTVLVSGVPSLMRYTILTTDFGIFGVGTFAGVEASSAFILYSLDYDSNNVYLVVDGFKALTTAARTPNQYAVANALDKFPKDNPLYTAIVGGGVAGAQQAFNALSGEIHGSVGSAMADDSRYVREAITGRLIQSYYGGVGAGGGTPIVMAAAAPTDVVEMDSSSRMSLGSGYGASRATPSSGHDLAWWSRAFGAWGQYDSNGNAATTDRNLGGFVTGVDGNMGSGWRAGLATGYLNTSLSAGGERYSSANINSYVLGAYAGGGVGEFALRSGGTWTWNKIDTDRTVVFPDFFEGESASYNGDVGQLFAELAYPIFTHGSVIEPFAGLAYVHVGTDSFTESGSIAGLTSGGLNLNLGYGTLGARAGTTVVWGGTTVIPHVSAAWQYAFGDTTPETALAFASTGIGMGIGGVPLAQNSALVEIGADAVIAQDATLGLSYMGQYSGDFTDNGLRGRFNWKF